MISVFQYDQLKLSVPGGLCKLLGCSDRVVFGGYHQWNFVAAGLLEDALQLPYCSLHRGLRAQIHLTDHDEDWHLQSHGQTKVLPRGAH